MNTVKLFAREHRLSSPFPHAQQRDILSREEFEALEQQFPGVKHFGSQHRSHDSLRLGMPEFREFLQNAPAWADFVSRLNRKEFIDHCLALFEDELPGRGALVDPDRYRFSSRSAPPYRTRRRSLANAFYYVQRGIQLSPPRRWVNERFGRDELYLQITLSRAGVGYGKQIHRDRAHQVILMLIYFDDLEDCGGELRLYRTRPQVSVSQVDRRRIPEDLVDPAVTVPCRANSGVIMLNTADSFHSVSPVEEGAPSRRFMGIAISKRYTRDAWKPLELIR